MNNHILIAALALTLSTSAVAQNGNGASHMNGSHSNAAQRSYQEARKVLDDGIQAMGGLEALR